MYNHTDLNSMVKRGREGGSKGEGEREMDGGGGGWIWDV